MDEIKNKIINYILKANKNNYLFSFVYFLERLDNNKKSYYLSRDDLIEKIGFRDKNKDDLIDIYIHIPFCKYKCNFCHTIRIIDNPDIRKLYINNLVKEIYCFLGKCADFKFRNLWVGGGTPNILSKDEMEYLFSVVNNFKFRDKSFRMIEVHPDLLTEDQINLFLKYGFNDISIGVQSFNPEVLMDMGRSAANIDKSKSLIKYTLAKNFHDVNCDLVMFTLKDNKKKFIKSLKELIDLSPDMITIYSLQISGDFNYLANSNISMIDFYKKTESLFPEYLNEITNLIKNTEYSIFGFNNYTAALYLVKNNYNMDRYHPFPYQNRSVLAFGDKAMGSIVGKIGYEVEFCFDKNNGSYSFNYSCFGKSYKEEIINHIVVSLNNFGFLNIEDTKRMFNIDVFKYFAKIFDYLLKNQIVNIEGDLVKLNKVSRVEIFRGLLDFFDKSQLYEFYLAEKRKSIKLS